MSHSQLTPAEWDSSVRTTAATQATTTQATNTDPSAPTLPQKPAEYYRSIHPQRQSRSCIPQVGVTPAQPFQPFAMPRENVVDTSMTSAFYPSEAQNGAEDLSADDSHIPFPATHLNAPGNDSIGVSNTRPQYESTPHPRNGTLPRAVHFDPPYDPIESRSGTEAARPDTPAPAPRPKGARSRSRTEGAGRGSLPPTPAVENTAPNPDPRSERRRSMHTTEDARAGPATQAPNPIAQGPALNTASQSEPRQPTPTTADAPNFVVQNPAAPAVDEVEPQRNSAQYTESSAAAPLFFRPDPLTDRAVKAATACRHLATSMLEVLMPCEYLLSVAPCSGSCTTLIRCFSSLGRRLLPPRNLDHVCPLSGPCQQEAWHGRHSDKLKRVIRHLNKFQVDFSRQVANPRSIEGLAAKLEESVRQFTELENGVERSWIRLDTAITNENLAACRREIDEALQRLTTLQRNQHQLCDRQVDLVHKFNATPGHP